ncbi:hypothetical protein GCM10023187_09120 [Nibrella viscosa]|uniref:Uncharacterized protein n=1 Tax=Nibrella viscosa TaxID=1084524 RepID=A0ABP8JZS8_9BACT
MDRRTFLQRAATGTLDLWSLNGIAPSVAGVLSDASDITITNVETVRFHPSLRAAGQRAHWMWVRLHTNTGIVGTGETYPFNEASSSVIKDLEWHSWAGKLLGTNPLEIEQTWERIFRQNAFHVTGGAERRALSARWPTG